MVIAVIVGWLSAAGQRKTAYEYGRETYLVCP